MDIVWVIDNSGSMADEQKLLGDNFNLFIQDFITKDIDFQMGITTTDRTSPGHRNVQEEKDIMLKLTDEAMNANPFKFVNDFKDAIKVGTRGSGNERGLKSSEVFSNIHANHFYREDAYLILVYVSDERDQSEKTVANHLKQIQKWKNNNGLIKAYSIVDMDNTRSTSYILKGYERYKEMSTLTGGYIANLYGNFSEVLGNMGKEIAGLSNKFPLSQVPMDVNAITVKVNGFEVIEWQYNIGTNTIEFLAGAVPSAGSNIEISYQIEE